MPPHTPPVLGSLLRSNLSSRAYAFKMSHYAPNYLYDALDQCPRKEEEKNGSSLNLV